MLRTALTPRWLGALGLALVLVAFGVQLGRWQWSVSQDKAREEVVTTAAQRPVLPLATALQPHQPFPGTSSGQRVMAKGSYHPAGQVLVAGRLLTGSNGFWVVERLRTDSGSLMVVRGWVARPAQAPTAPSGTLQVVSSLAPGEAPAGIAPSQMDGKTVLGSVDLAAIVNTSPETFYNAFGFVLSEQPAAAPGTLRRVPPPLPDTEMQLRNAAYAVQWWMFAAFVLFMWWRMVRQAAVESVQPQESYD